MQSFLLKLPALGTRKQRQTMPTFSTTALGHGECDSFLLVHNVHLDKDKPLNDAS